MKAWAYILLIAAILLGANCVMAQDAGGDPQDNQQVEDPDPVPDPEPEPELTPEEIAEIVFARFVDMVGAEVAETQLFASSANTLEPAYGAITQSTPVNAEQDASKTAMETLFGDAILNGSKGALTMLNGTYATGGALAGDATAGAIGAGGGVIANRQNSLLSERKALGGVDSALASLAMNANCARRIWASPFYTRQEMEEKDGYMGHIYKAWGVSLGYDRAFGNFFAGGALTYNTGDFDQSSLADDNTIDNYGFSLYGQYYCPTNNIFATLTAGYNYGDNEWDSNAAGIRATGTNHTTSYWAGASIGQEFVLPQEFFVVTPSIGLFWSKSESSAYSAGTYAFGKMKTESLIMPIDVKVEHTKALSEDETVTFTASAGYAYNWKEDDSRVRGSFNYAGYEDNVITIQGVSTGKGGWHIGGGLTYRKNNLDVGLNYRYDGKSRFSAHRLAATLGWSF